VFDTGVLGELCHPRVKPDLSKWLDLVVEHAGETSRIYIPEIADYELRRKLLHLVLKERKDLRDRIPLPAGAVESESIRRLDELASEFDFLPIDSPTMKRAALLWAEARSKGRSSSAVEGLDGDVVLAAQALEADAIVVTYNARHFGGVVEAKAWSDIDPRLV
jgi:predicted nucleic acid-binding protein